MWGWGLGEWLTKGVANQGVTGVVCLKVWRVVCLCLPLFSSSSSKKHPLPSLFLSFLLFHYHSNVMNTSDDDDDHTLYGDRPEWEDVDHIPQVDPKPSVLPIAYSKECT
jgi:hypothetical protein